MSLRPYSQRVLTTALVVCTWLAWPPCVTAQEANWVLRIQGTWSNPTNTFETIGQDAVAISAESNEPFGIAAALEYRFDALLGVEFGGGYSRPRIDVSASNDELTLSAIATTRFTPLTAGLNLHVVSIKVRVG